MDITKNYFEFIGLPVAYEVDLAQLSERARELQKTLHPDRFAHKSDREQRLAVQYTAYLNEGLATLRSPLQRAQYLLLLQGIDTHAEASSAVDPMFLMQQMELREQLEEIPQQPDPYDSLENMEDEVGAVLTKLRDTFAQQYAAGNLELAISAVRKMQFLEKLVIEIQNLEDRLDG